MHLRGKLPILLRLIRSFAADSSGVDGFPEGGRIRRSGGWPLTFARGLSA